MKYSSSMGAVIVKVEIICCIHHAKRQLGNHWFNSNNLYAFVTKFILWCSALWHDVLQ